MPADFEKCVQDGGRVRTKKLKGGKYMRVCIDKSGKSHAGEVKSKESLRWTSAITFEAYHGDKEKFKIKGTAIKARESRNGVTYEMVELEKAMKTLEGKTIAVNHSDNAEDVVGRIEKVVNTGDGLDFEGFVFNTIKHPYVGEMLSKSLFGAVSIESIVPKIERKDNKIIAREMEFIGLAFVRHPGIPEAAVSFVEALAKAGDEDDEEEEEEQLEILSLKEKIGQLENQNAGLAEKLRQKEEELNCLISFHQTAKLMRADIEGFRAQLSTLNGG